MEEQPFYLSHGITLLVALFFAFFLNKKAKKYGFYHIDSSLTYKEMHLPVFYILACFSIYLLTFLALPGIVFLYLKNTFLSLSSLSIVAIVQTFSSCLLVCFLWLFSQSLDKKTFYALWKTPGSWNNSLLSKDIFLGAITWLLGFPLVTAVSQLCDMLLYFFYGFVSYEQTAVSYFKAAAQSPLAGVIAIFIVLIVSPLVEEFLFRGVLQNGLKKYMKTRTAIIISSLCFAFFHMNMAQGLGNFSLFPSLAIFGLFLGFIYEKQQSLFASISLHATFNCISALRLLLFPNV